MEEWPALAGAHDRKPRKESSATGANEVAKPTRKSKRRFFYYLVRRCDKSIFKAAGCSLIIHSEAIANSKWP